MCHPKIGNENIFCQDLKSCTSGNGQLAKIHSHMWSTELLYFQIIIKKDKTVGQAVKLVQRLLNFSMWNYQS